MNLAFNKLKLAGLKSLMVPLSISCQRKTQKT